MAYEQTNWENGKTALSAPNMNNIETGINELISVVAGAGAHMYTEGYPYEKHEVVFYKGKLYKCRFDHSSNTFKSNEWDETDLLTLIEEKASRSVEDDLYSYANCDEYANNTWRKYFKHTSINLHNIPITQIPTCPYSMRPASESWSFVIVRNTNANDNASRDGWYPAWLKVNSDGTIKVYTVATYGSHNIYDCTAKGYFNVWGSIVFRSA